MAKISVVGTSGNMELTLPQKFDLFIYNIVNHPFLHYHPYLFDDDKIIKDAEGRAEEFEKFPDTIKFFDQCCCMCHIGKIKAEETYTSSGEFVKYKTLPIEFYNNKKCQEVIVNKSDFNPREYLTVCGFANFSSVLFLKKSYERFGTETDKFVKTSSLVDDKAEIESFQNCAAIIAYTIPVATGFGSLRIACRLYSVRDNVATVIREQILRTQQYILCTIINLPQLITSEKNLFDQDVFDKYLPTFKQMYDLVSVEIKERGITPSVKDEYLPTILDNLDGCFLSEGARGSLNENYIEEDKDGYVTEYDGLFAIREYPNCLIAELVDRRLNVLKPCFRNSITRIDECEYTEIYFEQVKEEQLVVCYASDAPPEDYYKHEWDNYDDEDYCGFSDNDYEHNFFFNEEYEQESICHHYLGLINRYGQTVFELKSIYSFRIDRYTHKFGFKTYDCNYILIYLSDSYDQALNCYTKCGAIDVRKGQVVIPLIFTEEEVIRDLSHGCTFYDRRYYNPGWVISFYDDEQYYFQGPVYKKDSDILEQGKYAGYTIKDALYFYGKEILYELIFEDKIFIADTVFPKNIAHFSSIERSVKLHQDKHLEFNEIKKIDDYVSTHSWFGYKTETIFKSLYEGKTLREVIEECNGMFYIKNLVVNGILKISEEVIDELMNINAETYLPLKNAYISYQKEC